MNLVLICKSYKFVLTKQFPPEATANTTRTVLEAYDRSTQANNKACCYMLVGITNVLRITCEKIDTAYDYGVFSDNV